MKILYGTVILSLLAGIASSLVAQFYLTERIPIIGSYVGLVYVLNKGIAFGMRIPGIFQIILIIFALFFVVWYAIKYANSKLSQIGFGFIIGGGFSNVLDRIIDGFVTDFFQIGSFPVFNTADSFITIGVAILFFEMIMCNSNND